MDDRKLKRAGLDYHEWVTISEHADFEHFQNTVKPRRLLAFSTRGSCRYSDFSFQADDALLFGPETRGLPTELLTELPENHCLRIPMRPDNRSLNLSNAVAIVLYEAWRQMDFSGA